MLYVRYVSGMQPARDCIGGAAERGQIVRFQQPQPFGRREPLAGDGFIEYGLNCRCNQGGFFAKDLKQECNRSITFTGSTRSVRWRVECRPFGPLTENRNRDPGLTAWAIGCRLYRASCSANHSFVGACSEFTIEAVGQSSK